jgi:phosphatidate cytidylyltransferase
MGLAATFVFRGDDGAMPVVWQRMLTAAVFIPLFVWALMRGPALLFDAFVVALAAAAAWELARLFERAGHATHRWLSVALTILVTASFTVPDRGPLGALALAVVLALSAPLVQGAAPATEPAVTTMLAVTYAGWLLGHAVLLRDRPQGAALVLFLVGVTWVGESAAYAVGSAVGRRKLAPTISPAKTVEGAVAQVIASTIAAVALSPWLLRAWFPGIAIGAGLLLGVLAQVGDLAESAIKRSLGAKDTGGLIPGHGGVLDRLDGLLFGAPALLYYTRLVETLSPGGSPS